MKAESSPKWRKHRKGYKQDCKIAEAFVQQQVDQAAEAERRREQDNREAERLAHAVPYRHPEDRQADTEAKARRSLNRARERREASEAAAPDEPVPETPAAQQGEPEANGSGAGSGMEGRHTAIPVARRQRKRIGRGRVKHAAVLR